MKKQILSIALLCCTTMHLPAQYSLNLENGVKTSTQCSILPSRTIEYIENGIEITYDFSSMICIDDEEFIGEKIWKLDGFSSSSIPGIPSLPIRTDIFSHNSNQPAKFEVIDIEYKIYRQHLAPAFPDQSFSGDITTERIPIQPYNGWFPKENIQLQDVKTYRKNALYYVDICPIQYDQEKGNVRVATKISYRLSYNNSSHTRTTSALSDNYNSDQILDATIPLQLSANNANIISPSKPLKYLILAPTLLSSAAKKFAEWKRCLGIDAHVVTKLLWDTSSISNAISTYYNANKGLDYLLLFGNNNMLPSNTGKSNIVGDTEVFPTDLPYACLDGESDNTPDVAYGRIPVDNLTEANTVIDKIIAYEKNPPRISSFYNNITLLGEFIVSSLFADSNLQTRQQDTTFIDEGTRAIKTLEEMHDYLVPNYNKNVTRFYKLGSSLKHPRNYSNIYTFPPYEIPESTKEILLSYRHPSESQWTAYLQEEWRKGTSLVCCISHGYEEGWCDFPFQTSNIPMLKSTTSNPIVISLACLTGDFSNPNCFASHFLKSEGGAIAVFASTEKTYFGITEAFGLGLIDAWYPNPGITLSFPINANYTSTSNTTTSSKTPIFEIGKSMLYAFLKTAEWSSPAYTTRAKTIPNIFHCFGDPSMRYRTQRPASFNNVSVKREDNYIQVTPNSSIGLLTFYDTLTGTIATYQGNETQTFFSSNPEFVIVTLSAPNYIPYINNGSAIINGVIE